MTSAMAILVVLFVTLIAMRVPIAFVLGLACLGAAVALGHPDAALTIASDMANGVDSFALLAIPFFIIAGEIMGAGGMARRLVNLAAVLVGRLPGGLALVNTVTCMLFGALSGSAAAAISSIGAFMIPEMERKGYRTDFSIAVTTASATTGLLIPPSNIMIVYAVVASNVSVAALFLAGVFPGVLIGLCIGFVCVLLGGKSGGRGDASSLRQLLRAAVQAFPGILLVVFVLGAIMTGVCTATEAAALAVAYAMLLWIADRFVEARQEKPSLARAGALALDRVFRRELTPLLLRSARTTAIVLLLIATSRAISVLLAAEQVPQQVSAALLGLSENPFLLLLLINLTLIVVGTVMDMTPAVLIFTPILLPVSIELGLDPVHFGIILIANLSIGLCTPPVGTCLFLGCSVGNRSIADVSRSMLPFYVAMALALLLITFFPALSTWLPTWMGQM